MMHEHEIESKLKKGIHDIQPERAIFEQTLKQAQDVASKDVHRTVYNDVPSPYQLSFIIRMKKFAYIGVPVIALALVTIFSLRGPESQKVAVYTPQTEKSVSRETVYQNYVVQTEGALSAVTQESLKDASVDDIMQGFLAEAEADARVAINDSFDAEYLYAELGAIPQVNSIDYENII